MKKQDTEISIEKDPNGEQHRPHAWQKYVLVLVGILTGIALWQLDSSSLKVNIPVKTNQESLSSDPLTKSKQIPSLKKLEALRLLPLPSADWSAQGLNVKTETSAQGETYRIYEGGQFADRLAYLSYELHFRVKKGDPPLAAWVNSNELRYQLLKRSSLEHLQETLSKLYIVKISL